MGEIHPDEVSQLIASIECKDDFAFAEVFRQKRQADNALGWRILEDLFSCRLDSDNLADPLGLSSEWSKELLKNIIAEKEFLFELASSVEDCEFKSRMFDALWCSTRDAKAAQLAVPEYLASALRLEDPDHWTQSFYRMERAVRLAKQIDPKGRQSILPLQYAFDCVKRLDGNDPLYFTAKLMTLLAEFDFCCDEDLASYANGPISEAIKKQNFSLARSYFEAKSVVYKAAKLMTLHEEALCEHAKTYVAEAEYRRKRGDALAASVFWGDAIKMYQDRAGLRSQVPELKMRAAEAGKLALADMKEHKVEIDISEFVRQSEEAISGRSVEEAFWVLLTQISLPSVRQMKEDVEVSNKSPSLHQMIGSTIVDSEGRIVGKRPGAMSDDPNDQILLHEAQLAEAASHHRGIIFQAHLLPMLRKFLEEHGDVALGILSKIMESSKVVRDDRQQFFQSGLRFGLEWDFASALHLMVPQAECVLRDILESNGVLPRNVKNGVEELWSFERMLNEPQMIEVLGEDFSYALRSVLVDSFGPKLRHNLAHGIWPHRYFQSGEAIFLWWLIIRLVALPSAAREEFFSAQAGGKEKEE